MKNLETILKNIGITSKEFYIYETLYTSGPLSVAEISQKLNIPRTTIYQNVENLLKKGLAAQTVRGNKKLLIAELPSKFQSIIKENKIKAENKVNELVQIENSLPSLVNYFGSLTSTVEKLPQSEIKFYEGHQSVSRVYTELLKYPVIKSYVDSVQIQESFPENVEKFNDSMKNGTQIFDLLTGINKSNDFWEKFLFPGRYYYKIFPQGTKISHMDYLIYGDNIAIIQGGLKPSALIIKNKILADNALTIYDVLWNLLPEPNDR